MKSKEIGMRHILPGYAFQFPRENFGRKSYHKFKNGHCIVERGDTPLDELNILPNDVKIDPFLTFGILRRPKTKLFIPKSIKYHGVTLEFKGYIVISKNSRESLHNTDNITLESCTNELQGPHDVQFPKRKENCCDTVKDGMKQLGKRNGMQPLLVKKSKEVLHHGNINSDDQGIEINDAIENENIVPPKDSEQEVPLKEINAVNNPHIKKEIDTNVRVVTNIREFLDTLEEEVQNKNKPTVILIYYLEDDSVEIKECIPNSTHYVTIVKRRRLHKKNVETDFSEHYYTWKDLNVGITIHTDEFIIHITSCNEFTRRFYTKERIDLCKNETVFNCEHDNDKVKCKLTLCGQEKPLENQQHSF